MASFVIECRALAGIQFEDIATGVAIRTPLHVRGVVGGATVETYANRRNIHVVARAAGLDDYAASFSDIPSTPGVGEVALALEVRDPSGVYLPRQFSLALPRTPDKTLPNSVYEPVAVPLLRSPRASRSRNWAMVRIRLQAGATTDPVDAALLRVVQDPEGAREILGWGMSVIADPEARTIERRDRGKGRWTHFGPRHVGEASVPVVGLNSQVWGVAEDEEVILSDIDATLEIVPMTIPGPGRLPDPDAFFSTPVAPGNSRTVTLSVGGDVNAEPFPVNL